ncbi:C2H2 zinc finger protein, partial [Trifolium pratense]
GDRAKGVTRYKEFEHWKEFIVENMVYVLNSCYVNDNDACFKIIGGALHEVVKTQTAAYGEKKPCTNLILANECGDMVDVTLWEAFSIRLMNYISDRKEKGPIILILTHAQCTLGGL